MRAAVRADLAGRIRRGEYVVDARAVAEALLARRPGSAVLVAAERDRAAVRRDELGVGARQDRA